MLASYHDPALVVAEDATRTTLGREEITRLARQASIAFAVTTMPRRMGSDASDEDLATDKKRARRIHHALAQCYFDWTKRKTRLKPLTSPEIRQEATQIVWDTWWQEQQRYLNQRIVYLATWALSRTDADQRWAKSALVRLLNELRWTEYALR